MEFYWGKGDGWSDKFVTPTVSYSRIDDGVEFSLCWWDFYISVSFVKGK